MTEGIMLGFFVFLLIFVVIGFSSISKKKENVADYLLAGRNVNPWFMALSAAASNNSGYMFIGYIGFAYLTGASAMWLMIPWVAGDYIAWIWIFPRFREKSGKMQATTLNQFLGAGIKKGQKWVIGATAMTTAVFLLIYSAAQLKAGSKALEVLFGWDPAVGVIIGAGILILYCYAGGIRASIWTDVAQSIVMIGAMTLLFLVALAEIGGLRALWEGLRAIDPNLVSMVPLDLKMGFPAYLFSWFIVGIGVLAQPHIVIRAMAIESTEAITKARRIYFVWNWFFIAVATGVGLAARVLIENISSFDPEMALPSLAQHVLPGFLVGMILAGIFSATMSTADSQVLSISAALTQDILPKTTSPYLVAKVGTLVVTAVALMIALWGGANVFVLVVISWSALAATLGPLMIAQATGQSLDVKSALGMMAAGLVTMFLWRYGLELSGSVNEVLPSVAAGGLAFLLLRPKQNRNRA